jgi:hypothetical protein
MQFAGMQHGFCTGIDAFRQREHEVEGGNCDAMGQQYPNYLPCDLQPATLILNRQAGTPKRSEAAQPPTRIGPPVCIPAMEARTPEAL